MEKIKFISRINQSLQTIRTAIQTHIDEVSKIGGDDKDNNLRLEINSAFFSNLKTQASKIYSFLNYSVLTGEYVSNENLSEDLKKIIDEISDLLECISEKDYKLEAENLYDVTKNIVNDIKRYQSFTFVFWKAIQNPYKNLLQLSDSFNDADNSVFMNIKDYSEVFMINLSLMFIDSNYSLANRRFYQLVGMKQRLIDLNKNIQEPFVGAIFEKIELLICKFRYKSDHKRQEASYFINDGKEKPVDFSKLPNNDLAELIGKINTRDKSVYEYNIRHYYENILEPKSTLHFFILCHYYKNVEPNASLLQKVEEDFKSFADKEMSMFSKANSKVCENYFRNCRLSFMLKQEDMNFKKAKAELENIRTLQIETQYDDYFPYYKVAEWELMKLEESIQRIDKVDFLETLLMDAKKNLDKARECLRTTKHNDGCFIPYRPFYQDCVAHITINDDLLQEHSLPLFCRKHSLNPVLPS